jgi:amino acid transporter
VSPVLRRTVTLPWLVLYGLGTTVGAGIYALTGVVAGRVGMHTPVAFLLASGLALFTALSFAELVSRYPRAAGEAVYVREAIGWRWLVIAVGLLVATAGVISAATVTVAFVGYVREFVALPPGIVVAGVALLLGGIAAAGVRESVGLAGVMTLVEVGGLLAIVGFGAEHLAEVPARLGEMFPRDLGAWHAVSLSTVLCFYAFLGFEDMVNVAEEVKDVRRALPLGILLTLGATMVLYAGVTTVAVLSVAPAELAESDAPLVLVFSRNGGSAAALGVIAMIALINGALIQVMKASRVLYGLAREGSIPAGIGAVHPRTRTPLRATAVVTLAVVVLALAFPLVGLAEATATITLATFGLANLSLILVKRRGPGPEGSISMPLWAPAVGLLVSVLFLGLEVFARLA